MDFVFDHDTYEDYLFSVWSKNPEFARHHSDYHSSVAPPIPDPPSTHPIHVGSLFLPSTCLYLDTSAPSIPDTPSPFTRLSPVLSSVPGVGLGAGVVIPSSVGGTIHSSMGAQNFIPTFFPLHQPCPKPSLLQLGLVPALPLSRPAPAHLLPRPAPAHLLSRSAPAHLLFQSAPAHLLPRPAPAHLLPRPAPAHLLSRSAPAHLLFQSAPAHLLPRSAPAHLLSRSTPAHLLSRSAPAYLLFRSGLPILWLVPTPMVAHPVANSCPAASSCSWATIPWVADPAASSCPWVAYATASSCPWVAYATASSCPWVSYPAAVSCCRAAWPAAVSCLRAAWPTAISCLCAAWPAAVSCLRALQSPPPATRGNTKIHWHPEWYCLRCRHHPKFFGLIRQSIYGVGSGDTKWKWVKGISQWGEQKTGLRWPQRVRKVKHWGHREIHNEW